MYIKYSNLSLPPALKTLAHTHMHTCIWLSLDVSLQTLFLPHWHIHTLCPTHHACVHVWVWVCVCADVCHYWSCVFSTILAHLWVDLSTNTGKKPFNHFCCYNILKSCLPSEICMCEWNWFLKVNILWKTGAWGHSLAVKSTSSSYRGPQIDSPNSGQAALSCL